MFYKQRRFSPTFCCLLAVVVANGIYVKTPFGFSARLRDLTKFHANSPPLSLSLSLALSVYVTFLKIIHSTFAVNLQIDENPRKKENFQSFEADVLVNLWKFGNVTSESNPHFFC